MLELYSFFKLYLNVDENIGGSVLVMLLMLYVNSGLYLWDFYSLVKRKSDAETMANMLIPFAVSIAGATLAGVFVYVPPPDKLEDFLNALKEPGLNAALMGMVVGYLVLWAVCFVMQKERHKRETRRWMLSCVPDMCFSFMLLLNGVYFFIWKRSAFEFLPPIALWVFLYAFYLLACKAGLLAVGIVVRIYSGRLHIFKWKEGRNPSLFLYWYFLICQNSILRNTFLFESGLLSFLTIACVWDGGTPKLVGHMLFLYLCGVFVILLSIAPVMKGLHRFGLWGDKKTLKKLFCQEYFIEDSLFDNGAYRITRHFLIDEQRPAAVYYWDDLKSVGNWCIDQKGKSSRTLYFYNGDCFEAMETEAVESEPVFAYAEKYLSANKNFPQNSHNNSHNNANPSADWYQSFMQKVVFFFVLVFMLVYMWVGVM